MTGMTKRERVRAALSLQEVDRVPVSLWYHLPEYDQDPVDLARMEIAIARKYDFDFIKMMPFGLYGVQDFGCSIQFFCTRTGYPDVKQFRIGCAADWAELEPLDGRTGTLGKQVQFAEQLKKQLGSDDMPFIQTVFSPLTNARKMAGDRVFSDMRNNPQELRQALEAITQTTISFVRANIEAGVSGFFFATQCAVEELMTPQEHLAFGETYDRRVFEAFSDDTFFNMIHIHGDNAMFETLKEYPANCINWHDRHTYPNLLEARKLTGKCLAGGINEREFLDFTPQQVTEHVREAIALAGPRGFMLTPGCCADCMTPEANFYAARLAVEHV